jgi:hypothetical protein
MAAIQTFRFDVWFLPVSRLISGAGDQADSSLTLMFRANRGGRRPERFARNIRPPVISSRIATAAAGVGVLKPGFGVASTFIET